MIRDASVHGGHVANQYHIQICLIDFGKARPTTTTAGTQTRDMGRLFGDDQSEPRTVPIAYQGGSQNKDTSQSVWRYSIDYEGLCGCVHSLLFLAELTTTTCTAIEAERHGYSTVGLTDCDLIRVPRTALKRYRYDLLLTALTSV